MPNVDNPYGFRYEYRLSDQSPPTNHWPLADGVVVEPGDPVKMVSGQLELAVAGDPVLGVVLGPYAVDDQIADYEGGPLPNRAPTQIILALPDVVFRVQDSAGGDFANVGEIVDYAGGTGATEITTGVVGTACRVFDIAGPDNIAGNTAGEAGVDMLVTFLIRALA